MNLWVAVTVALTCGAGGWWVGRVIERRRFDRLLETARLVRIAALDIQHGGCTCPPLVTAHNSLACPYHNPMTEDHK